MKLFFWRCAVVIVAPVSLLFATVSAIPEMLVSPFRVLLDAWKTEIRSIIDNW